VTTTSVSDELTGQDMTTTPVAGAHSGAGRRNEQEPSVHRMRLPILMYHGVHLPHGPGLYNARYSVTPEQFTRQLDRLLTEGFRTRLLTTPGRTVRDIVLTFDDGDESAVEVALPLLAERGMVAEFCIPSDRVGTPGSVSRRAVRELVDAGMGVQSHGRTHRQLSTLSTEELVEELTVSKRDLEDWSGRPVVALSAPGGRAGAREFRAARDAGYSFVLNSVPGPNRGMRPDRYLHRTVITSMTSLEDFTGLALWQGAVRHRLLIRTAALEAPKRLLGDRRYDRLRTLASR
jgi:peptidoglycan/xylan/chitin deacetylase (PgdA/CDA1 family)